MLLASIDIGTNSTRFLLAEVNGGTVTALKSGLITTRLGQGINHGRLLPEAMERTVLAIEAFLKEIGPFIPGALLPLLPAPSGMRPTGRNFSGSPGRGPGWKWLSCPERGKRLPATGEYWLVCPLLRVPAWSWMWAVAAPR
ncbi:hypothetical protein P378_11390 [Desulforamulus profundi]|uniref:Ppx/GppA phosphatase domain-containing protein n=1 Tax=Desulforamulus profundi TaxID=1383067 RepID=A0A2C6MFM6_9FIRM|nr:hypothetical protein P378_11390 [Desulforamulus profundi]